jgi:acetoacetyl-CoA synthetase
VVEETEINKLRLHVNETYKLNLKDSHDLHKWTIDEPSSFYETIWKRYNIIGDMGKLPVCLLLKDMKRFLL